MNTPKKSSLNYLHKPFEPTKEELQTKFRSRVLEQIPVAEIKLHYHKEVATDDRIKILDSRQASEILRAFWDNDSLELQEQFKILYLNNYNQVIGLYPHSQGGITGTLVDIRLILVGALQCGAVGMIACHNHPSSNTKPSQADKELTAKIQQASDLIDIKLLDHIILTKDNYYSFADEGDI
ncbi:MAG: DNA repair protein [Flavobacteriaceae bacterium]|nr:MAG: DNA repair protein [Flavobacteriaceae bacterium]